MAYDSVDNLQNVLVEQVFHYALDKKKAAGRALGTIVEIITYYLLKTWGFNNSISIEKGLVEYGNEEISHNVEYSLHPILFDNEITIPNDGASITPSKIINALSKIRDVSYYEKGSNNLLDKNNILRNACTIAHTEQSYVLSSLNKINKKNLKIGVYEQARKPYAIFECKRVGVEEGIKKAKQGVTVHIIPQ